MQNAPLGAFCNTFDLHEAIIGIENQFSIFLRVAVSQVLLYVIGAESSCAGPNINFVHVSTPGRRQSKTLILSTNEDQKLFETEFSIAICRQFGDKYK